MRRFYNIHFDTIDTITYYILQVLTFQIINMRLCLNRTLHIPANNHLIENFYFNVGNMIMKQSVGIPMEINPALFCAKYLSSLISSDECKARHFCSGISLC